MQLIVQGNDIAEMYDLSEALAADLAKAGLADDLSVSEPIEPYDDNVSRGDAATLITVAVAAVSAGGALTALLGKDGFLSALASVLPTYIQRNRVEVLIEKDGEKIQLNGNAEEVQAILTKLVK